MSNQIQWHKRASYSHCARSWREQTNPSRRSREQLLRIFRALQTSRVLHISMNARWRMNQLLNVYSFKDKYSYLVHYRFDEKRKGTYLRYIFKLQRFWQRVCVYVYVYVYVYINIMREKKRRNYISRQACFASLFRGLIYVYIYMYVHIRFEIGKSRDCTIYVFSDLNTYRALPCIEHYGLYIYI